LSGQARSAALIVRGDDPHLVEHLRAAAERGLTPTVVAATDDLRARRLAHALWAPVIAPGMESGEAVAAWDADTLDALIDDGWDLRPMVDPAPPEPADLTGVRAIHVTSVHRPDDGRIFQKEVLALRAAGADATVLGFDPRPPRNRRAAAGWRLMTEARRREPDVIHIHDPELLPAAVRAAIGNGPRVVYDAHEYLSQTTRTKPWIPAPLRTPLAGIVGAGERLLARGLDAVVAVTEDMALDFAAAGIDAVTVANFAPADRFADPGEPEPGTVVYVGALDRSRGLDLMLEAFPAVDAPDARLILAGPGDPGPLPPRVEHLGRLPYERVPEVLRRAAVVWMPLRRTPNNDRGRLTKVMEAMACGRPLVASDLRRSAAILRRADCGVVVPADDPAAHAAAITALLRDPSEARRLGDNGRRAFLTEMTFEREAAKLVDLYARLTGRRGVAA